MKRFALAATLLALVTTMSAQTPQPQNPAAVPTTHARRAPQPAKEAAPGGGPNMVWVNINSRTYHCPGDRYYGKTTHGRYMTEAAAKSAGAHGVGGKTCFGGK